MTQKNLTGSKKEQYLSREYIAIRFVLTIKDMVSNMIRVKPYKTRWCPRSIADKIRDAFALHDKEPDRMALNQEAKEFEKLIAQRRKSSEALYDTY